MVADRQLDYALHPGRCGAGKESKLLLWKRVSRAEVALGTGFFIYCLGGSIVFAFLPAFILEGNAGFIAMTQAVLILVLRFYFSGERKKSE